MKEAQSHYVFILGFIFFYTISIFVTNISNSQYIVSVDGYKDIFNSVKAALYISSFLILGFFYKINKYTILDLLICVVFMISYYYSRVTISVFIFFMFIKYVDFRLVVKTFMFAVLLGFVFVLVTYVFGLYRYTGFDMYRADGTFRSPLGYKYPTYLPNVSLFIYLGWVFLRQNRIRIVEIFLMGLLNYFIYSITDTRTIYYLVNLLLIGVIFIRYFKLSYNTMLLGGLFKFSTIYLFVILAVLSIYLNITYDPNIPWMDKLNKALSGRLYYGHKGFVDYGISLLGQEIEYVSIVDKFTGNDLFVIDAGYMKVLLDYGIVLFLLITYGFLKVGKRLVAHNQNYFGLIMIIMLLDVCVNPHMILLDFNPFFFALGYYGIYKDNLFK